MKIIRDEQRQHLNLSNAAYEKIIMDSISFENGKGLFNTKFDDGVNKVNVSGQINRIFLNYFEEADASISIASNKARERLNKYIMVHSGTSNTNGKDNVLDLIIRGMADDLQRKATSFPKEKILKIRLQNRVNDILYPEENAFERKARTWWPEQDYYKNRGEYIAAVIEEYAQKSYYEREGIFFAEMIDDFENNINGSSTEQRVITLEYATASGKLIKTDVKPYRITNPSESEYHYLIGLSKPFGKEKGDYSVGLFRLNRIIDYRKRPKSYGSGKLTQKEKSQIEAVMRKRGVLFLIDIEKDTKVLLTESGLKRYYNQIHLRPTAVKIESLSSGDYVAYFDCTYTQIRYYFFGFGKDAIILYPDSLQNEFKVAYEEALLKYKK